MLIDLGGGDEMGTGKSWYQSKTLWANVIAATTTLGAIVMGEVTWQVALPPLGLALMNFILRLITKQPIE